MKNNINPAKKELLSNEHIVFQSKRHWIVFLLPAILTLFAAGLLVQHSILVLLGYITLLLALYQWISSAVNYLYSQFIVTNKRLLVNFGLIKTVSYETLLQRVAGITVQQTILGKIFNYGTIEIQNTGGGKDVFTLLANPSELRRQVQAQMEEVLSKESNKL